MTEVKPIPEAEQVIFRTAREIESERLAVKEVRRKSINRIRRIIAEIEGNAKKATPGPWSISHSHVIKFEPSDPRPQYRAYDIASQPFDKSDTVYGVNPFSKASDNMRYIATVDPKRILDFIEAVREVLGEELKP